ncbi:MAG: peptidoglycan-binding protein [Methylibium sp.]|nr:peptidoglycan-binding protein [Methylibium sp.]
MSLASLLSISGSKQPLTLTRCSEDSAGVVTPDTSAVYKLVINPSEFSHERSICYNTRRTQGQTGNPVRFAAVNPDKLNFAVVFDGTGVVPVPAGNSAPADVNGQLKAMSDIVYRYNGQKHEPNIVQLAWGQLIFTGRLQSISTQYTLFRPDGVPLRAKSSLAFIGYLSMQEAQLSADRSSPDLSHLVLVREGDTLPLLCQQVYGDSRYYPEVARFNGLRQFRRLPAGLTLHFPPLA